MGKLSTHVLDTANGRPAAGVSIALYRCEGEGRHSLGRYVTNADGRCDAPLLEGAALQAGSYELDFAIGDYFAAAGVAQPEPAFLGVVTVRIGIADPGASHHVPLLVSPYGYSTYRGS
ncbi:hydroxyisourate hydrolase [Arenimonas sp.]|uniref:hydroxyisourate hydrolase n=1 Tax=Arenimonas sp. TaxID=1872635 RepID=UPI0039E65DAA